MNLETSESKGRSTSQLKVDLVTKRKPQIFFTVMSPGWGFIDVVS